MMLNLGQLRKIVHSQKDKPDTMVVYVKSSSGPFFQIESMGLATKETKRDIEVMLIESHNVKLPAIEISIQGISMYSCSY